MNKHIILLTSLFLLVLLPLATRANDCTIITFADGRNDGGIRQSADNQNGLDSPGDIFVFDQQLLAKDAKTVIGRNAGYCIRTDPGSPDFSSTDHPTLADDPTNNYAQCTWTLSFNKNSGYTGSITVAGREADLNTSLIPVIGGTGDFVGVVGVLASTPMPQNGNGKLFRQELKISFAKKKKRCPKPNR